MPLTRRLILQKARRHPARLRRIVGERFQVLFHSPPGYFSPFPHGTRPLSVTRKYLGLPGGPGRFTADFRGPPLLGNTHRRSATFTYRTLTVYGQPFQTVRLATDFVTPRTSVSLFSRVPQPDHATPDSITRSRFSLNPLSLATTHGITICFLFLRVLRCFTSPRSLHTPYVFRCG